LIKFCNVEDKLTNALCFVGKGCEDRSMMCARMRRKCEGGLKGAVLQQLCPRTCGSCEPCPLMAKACVAGE